MSQFQILGRRPFPFKAISIRFAYTNFPDTIPHLAAEDHSRRRYLELLVVTLPLLVQDFRRSPKCRVLRYQIQVNSMPQEYPRFLS